MEDSAKVLLGRCPKCQMLLPVLADHSVLKCGGCGAVLRAKHKGYISLLEISDEGEVGGDHAKSGNSSGSKSIRREQQEQKSQMGHEKGSKFSERMSNWQNEERDEMEGLWRKPPADMDGSFQDTIDSSLSEVDEIAHEAKMETKSTGSRLPLDSSSDTIRIPKLKETSSDIHSYQVEADIPKIEQQTGTQSLMAKADIPITTEATVLPLTDTPTTTAPVKVETLSKEDLDDQRSSFEVLKVSTVSQLKSLPSELQSLKIEGCESLEVLPDDLLGVGGIITPKELYLICCSSPRSFPHPGSLTTLYIRNCSTLEFLPSSKSRKKLAFLHHLFIGSSCDSLTTLTLTLFSELKILCIWDCLNLVSFYVTGEFTGDLASLESLEIAQI